MIHILTGHEGVGATEVRASFTGLTRPSEPGNLISAVETTELQSSPLTGPLSTHINLNRDQLAREQHKDRTSRYCYRKVGKEVRSEKGHRFTFLENEGLVYRLCRHATGRVLKQVVVPKAFKETILRVAHDSVMRKHPGIRKTTRRISEEFYWPNLRSDVKPFVRSCGICHRNPSEVNLAAACVLDAPFMRTRLQRVPAIPERSCQIFDARE